MTMLKLDLRNTADDDYEFLYDLHGRTVKMYIDEIWGWDDERELCFFREHFDSSGGRIIRYDSIDVGCVSVREENEYLFLAYIAILPPPFQS